jgi:hypothetical protein
MSALPSRNILWPLRNYPQVSDMNSLARSSVGL